MKNRSHSDRLRLESHPMKILWLDLNSSYAHSSLALPAIHAQVADDESMTWSVVSATVNEPAAAMVEAGFREQPDIIAGTAWLFNVEQLLHITARLKALLPRACVVMGGPEFLGDNEAFLRSHPFVSAVFRGEGEENVPRWLRCWNRRDRWREIEGLCYIDSEGGYVDNGTARVSRFEALVPPEQSPFFNWQKPFVQLETTRGCFNTCDFCVSGGEKPVRSLSIDAIRSRLEVISRHHIRHVRVLDRTFNFQPARAIQLLQLFTAFPHIRFHLEIHPALLSEPLKEALRTLPHGLLHLEAGIQSLHQEVLTASHRAGTSEAALEGLRFLCSLPNMETHTDLIAGLPLYSLAQLFDDVRRLASYRAAEIQLESLKLLPGTEMRRKAAERGICYSPYPPYEVLQTSHISPAELHTAHLLSRLLDAFYNTPAWQTLTRTLILEHEEFLHRFLHYLTACGVADQPLSLEKRGLLLYDFCKLHYPRYTTRATVAWIEAGLSLKKTPAARVKTRRQTPPPHWQVEYGTYKESLRLCFLPDDETGDDTHGLWFGYESEIQKASPVFKARS